MYGDYEAQRHWMEITTHLPLSMWYSYDLPYWGLDYPPLTAYISLCCGYMCGCHCMIFTHILTMSNRGTVLNKEWFALDSSRGHESLWSATYMRWTVVTLDACVYLPATIYFCKTHWKSRSRRSQVCLRTLMSPSPYVMMHRRSLVSLYFFNPLLFLWTMGISSKRGYRRRFPSIT